jgi:signal transduction histidine kinase
MKTKLLLLFLGAYFLAFSQPTQRDSQFLKEVERLLPEIKKANLFSQNYIDTLREVKKEYSSVFADGLMDQVLGQYWQNKGDQEKTLFYFNQSERALSKCCPNTNEYIEAVLGSGFTLIRSGLFNFDTVYFNKGYEKINKGYRESKRIGNRTKELLCLDFKGDYNYYSAFQKENMDSALIYYQLLEEKLDSSEKHTYRYIDSKHNMANVHRRLGNEEQSEIYYNEAIELSSKYGYNDILFAIFGDKAEVLEEEGRDEETLQLRLRAYEYALKTEDLEYINRIDRQLYSSYKKLGQNTKALEYLEKYSKGAEDMNKSGALQLQADIEKQIELDAKELEIARLENKNLSTTRNSLIVITLLSISVLTILYFAYRRLRSTLRKLTNKNKEILQAQLKGQNLERKRMAGELHDNLNTKIAAVRYRLEAQALRMDKEQSKFIDETIDLVNDIYEDIRLISHNLIPETVEEIGLLPSLNKLISTLNESNSVKFHLVSKLDEKTDLSSISYHLYNIVFELINNILKHSKADAAWISISDYEGKINVSVSDNGKGFEINENMGGFGVKSINSRVEQLNGKCTIKSSNGKGTQYLIEIPLT